MLVSLKFAVILFCALQHQARAKASNTFIYAGCSPSKFQPNTPFKANLDTLLTSIAFSASQASYNSYAAGNESSSSPDSAVYGVYQCRVDLSFSECSQCVQSAIGQLSLVCAESYAASLQLDGCYVRYSNENFLGKLDMSLAYRRCSASTTNDGDFFRRMDDVLGDLQNGASYRVSSSGTVQGHAQCLGDLNAADCAACLTQAVGQLKNTCGSALAADVFLAKCYARYWASGYYLHESKGELV